MNFKWLQPLCVRIIFLAISLQTQQKILHAQQLINKYSIVGVVTDADSKQPLEGVNIILLDTNFGDATDSEGSYRISAHEGNYTIKFSMIGYSDIVKNIVIKKNAAIVLNVSLKVETYNLDQVIVSPKPEKYDASGLTAVLDRKMIQRSPGSAQDIFWTLQTLPGVSSGSDDSKLYVRGGSSSENLVLFDGATIANPYHFEFMGGGLFSVFNSRLVENVNFYAGGFPARYGDRLASVLIINNKTADKENYSGELNMSLSDFNGIMEFPLKAFDGSGYISLRRSYFDIAYKLSPDLKNDNEMVPYFIDGNLKLDFVLNKNIKMTLFGLSSIEKLIGDYRYDHFYGRMESNGNNSLIGVTFNIIPTDNTVNELNIYYSLTDKKASYPENSVENYKLNEITVKNDFSWILGKHDFHFGGWVANKKDKVSVDIPASINMYSLEDYKINSSNYYNLISLYAEDKYSFSPELKMNTGLRYDYIDQTKRGVLSPRFNIAYAWNEHMSLSFDYGWFYQSPYAYEIGTNPNLKFKKAESMGVGIKHQLSEELVVDLEFYNKKYYDLITTSDDNWTNSNGGYGFSRGVELYVQFKPLENLSGWVSYSYSIAKRKEGIIRSLQYFSFDRTNLISVIMNYKFADVWALGAKFRHGTGTPYTPVMGSYFDQSKSSFIPILGEQNTARYPDYNRFDLRLTRQAILWDQPVEIYLEILNVFNNRNIVHWIYNNNYSSRSSMIVFPILPLIGINKKF